MTCIDRRSLLTRGAAVVGAASGDDGRKASEANRIAVIFVVVIHCKTKAELVQMIRDLGEELTKNLLKQLADGQSSP